MQENMLFLVNLNYTLPSLQYAVISMSMYVMWRFIVHKLTVYSKMLLSSTDQSHYTLHSFVAFCPIRSFLPVQLQELLLFSVNTR